VSRVQHTHQLTTFYTHTLYTTHCMAWTSGKGAGLATK